MPAKNIRLPGYTEKISLFLKLRRLFLEIPLFFSLCSLIEYGIWDSVSGWQVSTGFVFPHPYWIGILLFSLIYGIREGVFSGLIAATLFITFSIYPAHWNPLEWGTTFILPVLFVLIGTLLGIVSMLFKDRLNEIMLVNHKLTNLVNELNLTNERSTRANLNLEKKIVFRLETFQSVYDIAESLNKFNLNDLYKTVPELVAKYFKAQQCSFFLADSDGSLQLKGAYGWPDSFKYPNSYPPDDPLITNLKDFTETAVIGPEKAKIFGTDAFFLVPLITEEKSLLGMIKVELIDFVDVTQDNVRFLSLLGKWIIQSIVNGLRFAEREQQSTFEPETGLVRENAFWFRARKIVASAVRHKNEVVLLLLSLNFPKDVVSLEKNGLINKIGNIIKNVCRIDDEIGIADIDMPYNFLIMMPITNKVNAQIVLNKNGEVLTKELSEQYTYTKNEDFYVWETLSLEDGSLFLNEIVQDKIFDPLQLL